MDVYQRRRLVALSVIAGLFVIIVLLIRSCGDDEEAPLTVATGASGASGATGATGPLSQDDYIAEADAICLQANTTIANIDATDANEAASRTGDALASELNQLQSLPSPTEGEDELDKFLSALEDQIAAYDDRKTAVDRGDDAAVAEIDTTIDEDAQKVQRAADRFGFDACGDTSETGDATGGGTEAPAETTTAPEAAPAPATPIPAPVPEPVPVPTTPTTTTPVAPAPAPTTPTAPAAPEGGGGGGTPAPQPSGGGEESGSGGVSP